MGIGDAQGIKRVTLAAVMKERRKEGSKAGELGTLYPQGTVNHDRKPAARYVTVVSFSGGKNIRKQTKESIFFIQDSGVQAIGILCHVSSNRLLFANKGANTKRSALHSRLPLMVIADDL